jgi:hypothetical protein
MVDFGQTNCPSELSNSILKTIISYSLVFQNILGQYLCPSLVLAKKMALTVVEVSDCHPGSLRVPGSQ